MDKKQTTLTPELKEIYDRVMNTTAAPKTPPQTPPTTTPLASEPPHPAPKPAAPPPHPASPPPHTPPAAPTPSPAAADEALTSSPPRPVSVVDGTKPFSFSGTVKEEKKDSKPEGKKAAISLPILIVLGIAFIAVWAVFWLVMLGFINN